MRIERALVTLVLASAASISIAANVPASLRPTPDEVLSLQANATGVQIYTCSAQKDDPSRFDWTFNAPEAELHDVNGRRIGKHYGGPTWEAEDGSKVAGEVKGSDNGPDVKAIPWLLLAAKSNSGIGVFARTTSIQRLDTRGGRAPTDGCDAAQAGKVVRVPYTAKYYFFSMK